MCLRVRGNDLFYFADSKKALRYGVVVDASDVINDTLFEDTVRCIANKCGLSFHHPLGFEEGHVLLKKACSLARKK